MGRRVRADAWRQANIQANIKVGVEREPTGRESEPSELIYFKVYKSQAPVIEQAIDTAALMLGSDKGAGVLSGDDLRGFLGGAHLEGGPAPADPASRRLEVSIMRHDGEPGSPPRAISQSGDRIETPT